MKYQAALLFCCFLLVLISEASSLHLLQRNHQKLRNDDISSILNEDSSPYAYLEGNSPSVLSEPRFLQKQTPVVTPPAASAPLQPVYVAGAPPGTQLTRVPYIQPQNSQINENEDDPETAKLSAALEAVKEDIVGNSKQIGDEKKWVTAVSAITKSYEEKMKRVNDHVINLRKQQKTLFDKKKQIENLKLQKKLQAKLSLASDELKTLQNSLDHVQEKSSELNKEHGSLKDTIKRIETQLTKLKGDPKKDEKEKEKNDDKEKDDGEVAVPPPKKDDTAQFLF